MANWWAANAANNWGTAAENAAIYSQSDNTNLRKGKPLKKMNRQPRTHDRNTSNKRPRHLASDEILYRGLVSSVTQATPGVA